MTSSKILATCLLVAGGLFWVREAAAQGGLKEQKVAAPTRLDWEFAARGFGAAAAKLPAGFDSTRQRYQLFVPKGFARDRAWPLVLFISPGDAPGGWKSWQKTCEKEGVFFASPFGAGNNTPAGPRTRIVLDVLDDVRRHYPIDPDQTYLTGFSGGGRMACAIGFALPEYFGGILPVCGTNPLGGPTYLRHRIEDRLSVALVTGEKDFNRKENEVFMAPWLADLGIRSKLWVVPKLGHEIPGPALLSEVHAWLSDDLKRRRDENQAHPKLAVGPDQAPDRAEEAQRLLDGALDDLKQPERTWRGISLLQGITQRFGATAPGMQARALLKKIAVDDTLLQRIEEQGSKDEVKSLSAQALALERFGNLPKAIEAWEMLAKNYADTPIASKANENVQRLRARGK